MKKEIFEYSKFKNLMIEEGQGHHRAKTKAFFDYLEKEFEDKKPFDEEFFTNLTMDNLIEGIKFYIDSDTKSMVTKNAAEIYVDALKEIFDELHDRYSTTNTIFMNRNEQVEFDRIVSALLSQLDESKTKELISKQDFKKLEKDVAKFLSESNLEEKIAMEIREKVTRSKYYIDYVSILAIKFVAKYGISAKSLVNLRLGDFNALENKVTINGIDITLDEEMASLLNQYIKFRKIIIKLNNVTRDELFIKTNGDNYLSNSQTNKGSAEKSILFRYMKKSITTTASEKVAYKRILEFVDMGADIAYLTQLTGVASKTIKELYESNNKTLKKRVEKIISCTTQDITEVSTTNDKGMLRCPFCGKFKEAISDNWLLIEVAGTKKLSCRECEGNGDGVYRY